jgi:hypothetical protein
MQTSVVSRTYTRTSEAAIKVGGAICCPFSCARRRISLSRRRALEKESKNGKVLSSRDHAAVDVRKRYELRTVQLTKNTRRRNRSERDVRFFYREFAAPVFSAWIGSMEVRFFNYILSLSPLLSSTLGLEAWWILGRF